jgi:hypothetical protein
MNNVEVENRLRDCKSFRGVFMSDNIPIEYRFGKPCGIIVNLDETGEPGSHWVSIWFNGDGTGVYFDSFGKAPSGYPFTTLLWYCCPYGLERNQTSLQHADASSCGLYTIFFLKHKCLGASLDFIVAHFSRTRGLNELIVTMLDPDCY